MPNNLPPNWPWVKLGNVCEVVRGGSPRPMGDPKYFVGDIPFIKISDITKDDSKFVSDSHTKVNEAGVKKSRLLQKGSLILSNSGSVCIPKFLAIDACIHDGFVSFLNFRTEVDLNFLYHFFNYTRPYVIQKHKQGITQVNLNTTIVSEFEIPLPPLPEQQKIVEKIEELFSGLDSGVASLKKAKEQIRLYRQSVLASAFSGRLHQDSSDYKINRIKEKNKSGKSLNPANPQILVNHGSDNLPNDWKWVKLGEVIESIRYGTSKKCYYEKVGKPVLRIPNIINGYINDEDLKYSEFNKDEIIELSLIANDVLIIRSNGSISIVGKSAIVSQKHKGFLYAGYLIRIRLKTNLYNPRFLNLLLSSNQLRNQIEFKAKSTSGVNNINAQEIQAFNIPWPPLTQQTQIVEEIEKRFSEADNLEKAIDESLAKSETLRQSILKQAFEGRLV